MPFTPHPSPNFLLSIRRSSRRPSALLAATALCLVAVLFSCRSEPAAEEPGAIGGPRVLDERLQLTLFAEDPDIVTPIGIAIDSLDRIFVLESHTHLPPKDYAGPDGDQVKIFMDREGDGKPEEISVFAEGFKEGVNLAFSPEGVLYLVTSREVWALYDRNGDGVSEERVKVLELAEPQTVYAHAALLGVTFSPDGWMYVSRGNTGSAGWKMVGTDGSSVSGYGDGGNVMRARPDGTQLEEVATGFWNPMDLKFDERGRLLAADNDPDSRGPNRLVHIVTGGDYGYKSLYGGSGIHPYLAWHGELPGTLPYAVGLGEAPSGLLEAGQAALPPDYKGQMIASIWEESRIVRISLSPEGVSVKGQTEVMVEGDQEFRPVAFAADRKGTIYFTDWVLRDYPNHGRGRIWRLAARPNQEVMVPRPLYAPPLPNPEGHPLQEVFGYASPADFGRLKEALQSGDPFLRHAATMVLARPAFQQQAVEATQDPEAEVRLGALVALHRSAYGPAEPLLRRLLADPDERVRQRALVWIGREGLTKLKPALDQALTSGPVSPALFETYLETVAHLSPDYIKAYRSKSESYAKAIKRPLPPRFVETFVRDSSRPAALRALAVRHLKAPGEHAVLLTSLLAQDQDLQLRLEAVRTLAAVPTKEGADQLVRMATETANPVQVRAEALLALARQPGDASAQVIPLLQDPEPDVQVEAARYLRGKLSGENLRQAFQPRLARGQNEQGEPLRQQFALALSPAEPGKQPVGRPASVEEWEEALATGGNAERGRRVFFSVQSACSSCHLLEGRGGDLGPDLTNVGRSKTRNQLVRSVLRPSEDISPEYQGWYIRLKNGEMHQGRQIDVGGKEIELYTPSAGFVSFAKQDIQDYGMIQSSLMPAGLEARLTLSDMQDLIAFLEGKSAAGAGKRAVLRTSNGR
ncbi:c-type cytochrome [soil metagenome]